MKIYRVTLREDGDTHAGYKYTLLKSEASKMQKEQNNLSGIDDEVKELHLFMNKWDVVNFLNLNAAYPDNG